MTVGQPRVSGQQMGNLVMPGKILLDALAADLAHGAAALGIVQQLAQLAREVARVVWRGIERGLARRDAPFREIELHDRLAERHVLEDLVHGRLVVHLVGAVRVHAHVRGAEHLPELLVRQASRELNVIGDAEPLAHLLQRGHLGAGADDDELHVGAAEVVAQMSGGLEQQIDAFLLADDADVADQVSPALRSSGRGGVSFT